MVICYGGEKAFITECFGFGFGFAMHSTMHSTASYYYNNGRTIKAVLCVIESMTPRGLVGSALAK